MKGGKAPQVSRALHVGNRGGTETQRSGQHPNGSGPPKNEGTNGKRRFVFGSFFHLTTYKKPLAKKKTKYGIIFNKKPVLYEWEVKVRPIPAPSWARFGLSDGKKGLDPDCGRPDGPGKGPRTGVTASCPRSPRQVGTARDPRCFFLLSAVCARCVKLDPVKFWSLFQCS